MRKLDRIELKLDQIFQKMVGMEAQTKQAELQVSRAYELVIRMYEREGCGEDGKRQEEKQPPARRYPWTID